MQKIKTILVGNSGVGKTSLITQLVRKTFDEEYLPTIAGDKSTKEIDVNGKTLTLEIWDTAGQEMYKNVNKIFMKNSKIVILVYDMTQEESFKGLDSWFKQVEEVNDIKNIQFGVVANKSDLYEDRVIDKEEGESYAKSINAVFGETSSMDYDSVFDFFTKITTYYNNKLEEAEMKRKEEEEKSKKKDQINKEIQQPSQNIVLNNTNVNKHKTNGKGCC